MCVVCCMLCLEEKKVGCLEVPEWKSALCLPGAAWRSRNSIGNSEDHRTRILPIRTPIPYLYARSNAS